MNDTRTPAITPERLAQLRAESESEHRTHDWADAVVDELLTDAEHRAAAQTRVRRAFDSKGRLPADRVAEVHRHGDPVTDEQRAAATALLVDLLAAAERHGVTLADFDWAIDLPGGCLDAILAKTRH